MDCSKFMRIPRKHTELTQCKRRLVTLAGDDLPVLTLHAPLKSAPAEHREWRLAAAHCRDADALRRCVCREASFAGDSDGLDRPVSPALSGTSSTF